VQAGKIKINSVQDLEKLAKLEMFLREEGTPQEDTKVNIIFKRTQNQIPDKFNK